MVNDFLEEDAQVNHGVGDASLVDSLAGNGDEFIVEDDDPEFFVGEEFEAGAHVVIYGFGAGEGFLFEASGHCSSGAEAEFECGNEGDGLCRSDAGDHLGEGAGRLSGEFCQVVIVDAEDFAGHCQDAFALDSNSEEDCEEFGVSEGADALVEGFFARFFFVGQEANQVSRVTHFFLF